MFKRQGVIIIVFFVRLLVIIVTCKNNAESV